MPSPRQIPILLILLLAQPLSAAESGHETAILAGGCFWCIEADYEKLDGVIEAVSGYTGGDVKNPTYEQVSAGGTGHAEAVKITYDPGKLEYAEILDYFWHHIDPTRDDGQFCDTGHQYRPAIFTLDDEQRRIARQSRDRIAMSKPFPEPLKVGIVRAGVFYPAEEYHQDYYKKNPLRYRFYRYTCGRDSRVEALWGEAGAE